MFRRCAPSLCGLLSFCSLFYCGSFFSLVQARSDASPLRRAGKSEVRNRVDSWDLAFGAVLRAAKTALFHYDGQLSTRQLTDTGAQITDSYIYDAFGILLSLPGPTPNNYLYSGEHYDSHVSFYSFGARYYNHNIGRFVTTDLLPNYIPLDEQPWNINLSLYLYADADPVNKRDPSGYATLAEQIPIIGTIAGVLARLGPSLARGLQQGRAVQFLSNAQDKAQRFFVLTGQNLQRLSRYGYDSFDKFKQAVGDAGTWAGVRMHWHHIVEQTQNFSVRLLNNSVNLIRLPAHIHEKISAFYSRGASSIGGPVGQSVRQWLSGKSFEVQYNFGIEIIKKALLDELP